MASVLVSEMALAMGLGPLLHSATALHTQLSWTLQDPPLGLLCLLLY